MAELKTKPTEQRPEAYLKQIDDPGRRKDALTLLKLMAAATGEKPTMWGASMVGFGAYHYRYASGREGDSFRLGFASRKAGLTLYLVGLADYAEIVARLGKTKQAKGCLTIRSLADVDEDVLVELLAAAVKHGPRAGEVD
jgi:hypothetical protein